MLRFEPFGFVDDADAAYGGVIATSANAVRAIESQLANSPLLKLPLFAVGERTAAIARQIGHLTMERNSLAQEVRQVDRAERRAMIDRAHPTLSISRQCQILGLSRASIYRRPADPTRYSRGATEMTLGFNWYLNRWVRQQFNWEHAWFDDPVQLGPSPRNLTKDSDALLTRFQIIF